jgi:hypothetical protein
MFAKTIIGSDIFLDMPQSTQALYFHLAMRADDDGFVNSPKSIMRLVGCKDDDLKILCSKKFVIPFDSGIIVIKHWRIHNYIAKDRYTETKYKNERAQLKLDENGSYTECIHDVHECETQVRLGKVRLGEEEKREPEEVFSTPRKSIPIENDGSSRIERARQSWNALAPAIGPECRLLAMQFRPDDAVDCLRTMSAYSDAEIAEAIKNYHDLKTDPELETPHYGSFMGFIRGGVEKFVSTADPRTNFKRRSKGFETAAEREDRERAEALKRLGVE